MTFLIITEAQRLVAAAGGEFRPRDKLMKRQTLEGYWWTVCENLAMYADVEYRPRTIERFFREGYGGPHLINALKKAAEGRAEARRAEKTLKVSTHDAKFIADLRKQSDYFKKTNALPREEISLFDQWIDNLYRVAHDRQLLAERFAANRDALAMFRTACQIAKALLSDEATEAAE